MKEIARLRIRFSTGDWGCHLTDELDQEHLKNIKKKCFFCTEDISMGWTIRAYGGYNLLCVGCMSEGLGKLDSKEYREEFDFRLNAGLGRDFAPRKKITMTMAKKKYKIDFQTNSNIRIQKEGRGNCTVCSADTTEMTAIVEAIRMSTGTYPRMNGVEIGELCRGCFEEHIVNVKNRQGLITTLLLQEKH